MLATMMRCLATAGTNRGTAAFDGLPAPESGAEDGAWGCKVFRVGWLRRVRGCWR